jgi:hypothetical protein
VKTQRFAGLLAVDFDFVFKDFRGRAAFRRDAVP